MHPQPKDQIGEIPGHIWQDIKLCYMGEEVGITARMLIRRLRMQIEAVEVTLGGSVFKGKGTS
jgi:hypothetical protein